MGNISALPWASPKPPRDSCRVTRHSRSWPLGRVTPNCRNGLALPSQHHVEREFAGRK